jgi:phage terminase large subunit GpA-like protein
MSRLNNIGIGWIVDRLNGLTDSIMHVTPVGFNEQHRVLPESVSSLPGPMTFDVNPFAKEILNCFDEESPIREVNVMKGVQITYTTILESIALYYMAHVRSLPIMYITADKELADARIENNFIPMLNQSGFASIVRSSDEGNTRKTGKTAEHIQFEGGGYLVPFGAQNARKMRQASICIMLKDEIDAWPLTVGKDGDPHKLTDDRCSGYWERRKIFRGSTPLLEGQSKIHEHFLMGDQRVYLCLCKKCGFPQEIKWGYGKPMGCFEWDTQNDQLIQESVRYKCANCGQEHFEHDKTKLFSDEHGAHWSPTATPISKDIRSYYLPALYSPVGMQPWYKAVSSFLKVWDIKNNRVRDVDGLQVFYNNVLAKPFRKMGMQVSFAAVSNHRRGSYGMGMVPNRYAIKFAGSKVLFLVCTVDVHKNNLAVAVFGVCRGARTFLIEYSRIHTASDKEDCAELMNPVWGKLRDLIETKVYQADDGSRYRIALTFVDSGYATSTVNDFCAVYAVGVCPILGRERTAKYQTIKEFAPFTTQIQTTGYRILVDHYKDRLAPVLRREWMEESGEQNVFHFNAPADTTDDQLRELTAETRREVKSERGTVSYEWHRPGNKPNELWDLLVYCHAAIDIIAYGVCVTQFELDTIDWDRFWSYIDENRLYELKDG